MAFSISGPGEIVATDNGDAIDLTTFSSKSRKLSPSGNVAVDVKPLGKLLHDANYVGKHIDLLRVGTNGTEMDILRRSLERVHARTSTPAPSVARKCMS